MTGLRVRIALAIVLIVSLAVLAELVAGFYLDSRKDVDHEQAGVDAEIVDMLAFLGRNSAPIRADASFVWSGEPLATQTQSVNAQAYGSTTTWSMENNSQGFRGREREGDSAGDDVYRILCIGDSVTFGSSVDQDDSYPAQLVGVMRGLKPEMTFEVINAGVPGWSWIQSVRFLELRGLALEPDLVIMAQGISDQLVATRVTDAELMQLAKEPGATAAPASRGRFEQSNVSRLIDWIFDLREASGDLSPDCQQQMKTAAVCRRVSSLQIERAIDQARRLTESRGIELLIANLDFMKTPAAESARTAAEAAGIGFIGLVHQQEFERGVEDIRLSDQLRLRPAGDRASLPYLGPVVRERRVLFRMTTSDTTASYSARGVQIADFAPDSEFRHPLNDEGRDGDERAGDGVFSGILALSPGIDTIRFKFFRGDVAEFHSPVRSDSILGVRSLHVIYNLTTPVYGFAERPGMVDRAHPSADGHASIADALGYGVWWLPSFER